MFGNRLKTITQLLPAASCANTSAATGAAWTDIRNTKGDITVTINIGAVTGSIVPKCQTASADDGTGAADLTPIEGVISSVSTSDHVIKVTYAGNNNKGYIKFIGTITTGPVLIGVEMLTLNV